MNESSNSTVSFDRMRNMLVRAAEIRESEQQQVFDALDEIHARLAPLESFSLLRKRVEDAMIRLDNQDSALSALGRAVESIVDRLATPFAQLDGRLDGVTGRFEGVAGRMDGLEDKLANIHRRLDELDGHLSKQDSRLDSLPGAVHGPVRDRIEVAEIALRGRMDEVNEAVRVQVDDARDALHRTVSECSAVIMGKVDEARTTLQRAVDDTRDTVDSTERLESLAKRLEHVTGRLDELTGRLDKIEDDFAARISDLGGAIEQSLSKVEGSLAHRPDAESVASLVRSSSDESVRRIGGHLDEAMATFAELMMGGAPQTRPPTTLPRQSRRRNGKGKPGSRATDGETDEGAEDSESGTDA